MNGEANGAWRFVGVPKDVSGKIKDYQKGKLRRGWGAVKVKVKVAKTEWITSIFPDKRSGTFLLPLKAKVRQSAEILDDDIVSISLELI